MSEEKKKDSFTFSDKIKNSKQTSSKSFANRISSKIGSDGKPRQTLFERTKRDAPFFIAALVALLLLPFLYKYSGQVAEEPAMITPGYEDAMVNPDRSGFDFTGDPEGQIAQLAGRDSLDLIVGFGKKGEDEGKDESLADIYRSGLDDSAASSYSRNATEEEVNNTNIYKYRNNAAPQTRAAIRRAATKINGLRREGVARGSGGHGISPWGGSMKSAASKVRGPAVRNSVKPVSLQPLQAAGKPSRSYFGGGPGAAARQSKEAMGKANAMQALMDAQFKPVDPGRIGGLNAGDYGGPGGGAGNLARNFTYNGKEPWWWDMMKRRSQMKWEAWFNYGWKWMNWATDLLQNQLAGIFNCLVMGNSDGDPDTFLGSGGGSGGKATKCCGMDKTEWESAHPNVAFEEKACKGWMKTEFGDEYKTKCAGGWEPGRPSSGTRLGPIAQRKKCLGGVVQGDGLFEKSECRNLPNKSYIVEPKGQAKKWHTYVYIVARNYVPEVLFKDENGKPVGNLKGSSALLCQDDTDPTYINSKKNAGLSLTALPDRFDGTKESVADQFTKGKTSYTKNEKGSRTTSREDTAGGRKGKIVVGYDADGNPITEEANPGTIGSARNDKNTKLPIMPDMYEIDPESYHHACVVYITESNMLVWSQFQGIMIDQLKQIAEKQGVTGDLDVAARKAFDQLDLMFVSSLSMKQKLGRGINARGGEFMGMLYDRFYDAYILHKGTATSEKYKGRLNVDKRKYRDEDKVIIGPDCPFDPHVSISCEDATGDVATAKVDYKKGFKGKDLKNISGAQDGISVSVTYTPIDVDKSSANEANEKVSSDWLSASQGKSVSFGSSAKEGESSGPQELRPQSGKATTTDGVTYTFQKKGKTEKGEYGNVVWSLSRGGKVVDTAECEWNPSGAVVQPVLEPNPCKEGETTIVGNEAKDGTCSLIATCKKKSDGTFDFDKANAVKNTNDPDCQGDKEKEYVEVEKIKEIVKEKVIYVNSCKDFQPMRLPIKDNCEAEVFCQDDTFQVRFIGSGCEPEKKEKVVPVSKLEYFLHSDIKKIPVNTEPYDLQNRPEPSNLNKTQPRPQWGTCKITEDKARLVHQPDAETMAFVQRAKDKFEAAHPGATLLYDEIKGSDLTVANLMDVINMDPDSGMVPANVVCILGKTIGTNSSDPQAEPNWTPGKRSVYDNVFGSFLAYINYDMAFYPSNNTTLPGGIRKQPDPRFLSGTPWYWGGYVNRGDRAGYEAQIRNSNEWRDLPLKGLSRTLLPASTGKLNSPDDTANRNKVYQEYADLFTTKKACNYSGKTISRADVLKYIESLCTYGTRQKPTATWQKIGSGSGYSKQPGNQSNIGNQ